MGAARLRTSLVLAYGAGSIGSGIISTVPGLLLLFYLTDTLGVPAGLAGMAVLLPRLLDLVSDPIVGAWSDRHRGRWGRRRPFLLAGALALPPCFVALFAAPTEAPLASFAWVLVAYVLATSAFTLFQIPYAAMPAELTPDYHERTRLVAFRMAFVTVGVLASGALAPALIDAGGGGRPGYLVMAFALAAVSCGAMLAPFFGAAGAREAPPAEPRERVPVRAELRSALAQRPFRILLTAYHLQCVALGVVLAAVPYFVRYVLGGGNGLLTLLFVCLVGPAIVGMPLWTAVSRRMGKLAGYRLAAGLFVAAAATLLMAGPKGLPEVCVQVGALGVGFAGLQLFPFAILPELIDADAAAQGRRREGVFTALWFVGEKGGFTIGAWTVSLLLAASGFVESRGGAVVPQPDSALRGVLFAASLAPALIALASFPFLLRFVEPPRDPET